MKSKKLLKIWMNNVYSCISKKIILSNYLESKAWKKIALKNHHMWQKFRQLAFNPFFDIFQTWTPSKGSTYTNTVKNGCKFIFWLSFIIHWIVIWTFRSICAYFLPIFVIIKPSSHIFVDFVFFIIKMEFFAQFTKFIFTINNVMFLPFKIF